MTQLEAMLLLIAQFNPQGINLLADKYGYERPNTFDLRVGFLTAFLEDKGDDGLREIALLHPDRELIIEAEKETNPVKVSVESRADGSTPVAPIQTIVPPQKSVSLGSELSNRQRLVILIILTGLIYIIIKQHKD